MFVLLSPVPNSVEVHGISKKRDIRTRENDVRCSGGKFLLENITILLYNIILYIK